MYEKITTLALLAIAAYAEAPMPASPLPEDWTEIGQPDDFEDFPNNIESVNLALWDDSDNAFLADSIDNGDTNGWVFAINVDFSDSLEDGDYVVVGTYVEGEDNSWGILADSEQTLSTWYGDVEVPAENGLTD